MALPRARWARGRCEAGLSLPVDFLPASHELTEGQLGGAEPGGGMLAAMAMKGNGSGSVLFRSGQLLSCPVIETAVGILRAQEAVTHVTTPRFTLMNSRRRPSHPSVRSATKQGLHPQAHPPFLEKVMRQSVRPSSLTLW